MGDTEKLLERARDELFSHVNRCGVLQASPEDQREWMDETIEYIGERYPDLSRSQLDELYNVGIRFCRPPIPHGDDHHAGEDGGDHGESKAPEPVKGSGAEDTDAEKEGASVA